MFSLHVVGVRRLGLRCLNLPVASAGAAEREALRAVAAGAQGVGGWEETMGQPQDFGMSALRGFLHDVVACPFFPRSERVVLLRLQFSAEYNRFEWERHTWFQVIQRGA